MRALSPGFAKRRWVIKDSFAAAGQPGFSEINCQICGLMGILFRL
jgi:hypothetical protein